MNNEKTHGTANPVPEQETAEPTDATDTQAESIAATEIPAVEYQGLIERIQRLQAEFENYKKRTNKEILAIEERVSDQTILAFLPIYENLHRAFASYAGDKSVSTFISGIEQIYAQFDQLLKQLAVSRLKSVGKKFDPAEHDALLSVESEEEKNTIVEEFAPGYVRNDRVLQPSKVSVSQGPAQPQKE